MGLKSETRTIDGLDVTTVQFPAVKAFGRFTRLVKILSPVLGELGGITGTADISVLGPALSKMFEELPEAEAESILVDFLSSTYAFVTVDGVLLKRDFMNRDTIDSVFNGRMLTMLKTLIFAIEVNYKDFFTASGGPATLAPATKPASP